MFELELRAGAINSTAQVVQRYLGLTDDEARDIADALHNGRPVVLKGVDGRTRLRIQEHLAHLGYLFK